MIRSKAYFSGIMMAATCLSAQPAFAGDLPAQADEIARAQAGINSLIQQSLEKLSYLKQNAAKCTRYANETNQFLLKPFSDKLNGYKNTLDAELKKLAGALKSDPKTFENVNACMGYKTTAVADFSSKKSEIQRTRAALTKEITQPSTRDTDKLYFEGQSQLWGQTGHGAAVKAFTADSNYPDCSPQVLATFLSFAEPKSRRATLNNFNDKMKELDALLNKRTGELDQAIASIGKTNCDTVAAAAVAEPAKAAPVPVPVAQPAPAPVRADTPAKAEVVAKELPTAPVVKREAPRGTEGSTPVVGAILNEQQRNISREPASVAPRTYEPLAENDKWKAPTNWKSYDDYKASINAPNKVTDVNLGQHYTQFLSSNSVQVRSEEDALRLQKAINAASMQVNGEGVGISVYQDGRVGSRTMSAAYMMQNDPVYRPVFLAELRKQGLIRF